MGSVKNIRKVVTYNRNDCCGERLANYQIRIGNNPDVFKNPTCPGLFNGAQTILCNLPGRYLGVVIPGDGNILTLCEVEAFEEGDPLPEYPENVLIGGVAS